jgi:hypothetical protein
MRKLMLGALMGAALAAGCEDDGGSPLYHDANPGSGTVILDGGPAADARAADRAATDAPDGGAAATDAAGDGGAGDAARPADGGDGAANAGADAATAG